MTDYLVVLNLYVAPRRTESGQTLWVGRGSLSWGVWEQTEEKRRSRAQGEAECGKEEGNQPGA